MSDSIIARTWLGRLISPTVFATQLAEQQAQSLAASDAAEERIQALEQRLDSHAQASPAQQTGAGDPPAMAAPGWLANLILFTSACSYGTSCLLCLSCPRSGLPCSAHSGYTLSCLSLHLLRAIPQYDTRTSSSNHQTITAVDKWAECISPAGFTKTH